MLHHLTEPASDFMVREQFRALARVMPLFYVALLFLDAAYLLFSDSFRSPLQDGLVVLVAVTAASRARYWMRAKKNIDAIGNQEMRKTLDRSLYITVFVCLICVGATQNLASLMDNEGKIFIACAALATAIVASFQISIVPRNAVISVITTFGPVVALLFFWGSDSMRRAVGLMAVLGVAQIFILLRQYEALKEIIESREALRLAKERLRIAEKAALTQALTDPLTGLNNRRYLDQLIEQSGSRFAFALIDLDGFKALNDEHGHAAGDMLLKLVAGRLYEQLHHLGEIVRLGGDEFALLCRNEALFPLLQDALNAAILELNRPYVLVGTIARVGASSGLAIGAEEEDPHAVMAAADRALYEVKRSGKGFVKMASAEGEHRAA